MRRPLSALFAVFLVSGLVTGAGLAGAHDAGATERAASTRAARSSAVDLAELDALRAQAGQAELSATDWADRVDARLKALEADSKHHRNVGDSSERRGQPELELERALEDAVGGLGPKARVAVELRDLDSGARLASIGAERGLHPASTQKLITAIAAVELLGPDYRFETSLSREGDALVLRGQGDPDLHLAELHALASAAMDDPESLAGVTRVVVDDSAFSHHRLGPGFGSARPGDFGHSYMAPSGALAMDYATVEVTVRPGRFNGPACVALSLPDAAVEIVNHARTGFGGELEVRTEPGSQGRTRVIVEGWIPAGHAPATVRRRVSDPGLAAGAAFADVLARVAGKGAEPLPVVRGRLGATAARSKELAVHRSAPLTEVLSSALRFSNNFTAEQVLRTLAWRATDTPGSWDDGVAVLERFAAALTDDERLADQRFVNGSGLNRDGRLSPAFLVDALALTQRPGSPAQALLASFAEAGSEGTLRGRLPGAGGRLIAKTGTYGSTSSLAGIVYDEPGQRPVAFAILVNGESVERSRAAQDAVVAALLRHR